MFEIFYFVVIRILSEQTISSAVLCRWVIFPQVWLSGCFGYFVYKMSVNQMERIGRENEPGFHTHRMLPTRFSYIQWTNHGAQAYASETTFVLQTCHNEIRTGQSNKHLVSRVHINFLDIFHFYFSNFVYFTLCLCIFCNCSVSIARNSSIYFSFGEMVPVFDFI